MNRFRFAWQSLSILAIMLAGSAIADAQATRTWVSGTGDDANPCSRTAPCKTFQGSISKTAAGGEINVLDPGGFGAVTITKAITISSVGFEAGVLVSGTNGIIVNAGVNDVVILRGLDFEGLGTGLSGVRYIGGAQLVVEDCTFNGFGATSTTSAGIEVDFTNQPALTVAALKVKNVRISRTTVGIRLSNPVGVVTAAIDNLEAVGLGSFGLQTQANAYATVTNSRFDRIGTVGVTTGAALEAENSSNINAENVTMSFNTNGVQVASATATIRISNCDLLGNTTGINITPGGKVVSFGNNRMAGNPTAGAPTSTVAQN